MLDEVVSFVSANWALTIAILISLWLAKNQFNGGLNRYPGPWMAGLTDWWRLYQVRMGNFEQTNIELHRKYGDVIRYGPNALSFADPKALKIIYGLNKGYVKVEPLRL
jgi:hypothetical protein